MKLIAFIFTLIYWMMCGNVFAQNINLKDVSKIHLVERWGGASVTEKNFGIINENGSWKSYRTKLAKGWNPATMRVSADSSTVFVKNIRPQLLENLLLALANPDTGIVVGHYKLDNDSLIKYTDAVHPHLTAQQKAKQANSTADYLE